MFLIEYDNGLFVNANDINWAHRLKIYLKGDVKVFSLLVKITAKHFLTICRRSMTILPTFSCWPSYKLTPS